MDEYRLSLKVSSVCFDRYFVGADLDIAALPVMNVLRMIKIFGWEKEDVPQDSSQKG